jgi:hypothetical protein
MDETEMATALEKAKKAAKAGDQYWVDEWLEKARKHARAAGLPNRLSAEKRQ